MAKHINKRKRLRRLALLSCHFTRNLAYTRAWTREIGGRDYSQILITINNNFIDMAVMEWCKIFADKRGKHYWESIVNYQNFKIDMLSHICIKEARFENYIKEMLHYRDKFIAHLDDEDTMNIPRLDIAEKAVLFLYDHLVLQEASEGDLDQLPTNLPSYYRQCFNEVSPIIGTSEL